MLSCKTKDLQSTQQFSIRHRQNIFQACSSPLNQQEFWTDAAPCVNQHWLPTQYYCGSNGTFKRQVRNPAVWDFLRYMPGTDDNKCVLWRSSTVNGIQTPAFHKRNCKDVCSTVLCREVWSQWPIIIQKNCFKILIKLAAGNIFIQELFELPWSRFVIQIFSCLLSKWKYTLAKQLIVLLL